MHTKCFPFNGETFIYLCVYYVRACVRAQSIKKVSHTYNLDRQQQTLSICWAYTRKEVQSYLYVCVCSWTCKVAFWLMRLDYYVVNCIHWNNTLSSTFNTWALWVLCAVKITILYPQFYVHEWMTNIKYFLINTCVHTYIMCTDGQMHLEDKSSWKQCFSFNLILIWFIFICRKYINNILLWKSVYCIFSASQTYIHCTSSINIDQGLRNFL